MTTPNIIKGYCDICSSDDVDVVLPDGGYPDKTLRCIYCYSTGYGLNLTTAYRTITGIGLSQAMHVLESRIKAMLDEQTVDVTVVKRPDNT